MSNTTKFARSFRELAENVGSVCRPSSTIQNFDEQRQKDCWAEIVQ